MSFSIGQIVKLKDTGEKLWRVEGLGEKPIVREITSDGGVHGWKYAKLEDLVARSFMAYVNTVADPEDVYTTNDLAFETAEEATWYAKDLAWRWTAVESWKVEPSSEPVSHECGEDGKATAIPKVDDDDDGS